MAIQQLPAPTSGIPTGATSARPSSPVIGDVFYNGTDGILEIYDGTQWLPCSAPPSIPSIAVADVGTSVAYGTAKATVTFTPGSLGGKILGYTATASTGGYSATSSSSVVTVTVGNNGSYTFSGVAYNDFGTSVSSPTSSATLTTVPQAPTIGTATTSGATTDVSLTWTLGSDGGKSLTSITITPYLNGTTAQTPITAATTTATSATITGLTQGSSYTFKVKSTNANGSGLESNASNSITVPTIVSVDFLVVAGGGGGGNGEQFTNVAAGGGGAGGLRSSVTATGGGGSLESALGLSLSTNYTVTVGAGGVVNGTGSASQFSNINASGGGRGGNNTATNGGNGGSGGGGFHVKTNGTNSNGGNGTSNQGYAGGNSTGSGDNTSGGAGGGGGAANAGGNGVNNAGAGGNGVSVDISGSSVTYAGGGGGGGTAGGNFSSGFQGNGGNGGGGNGGSAFVQPNAGTANRGGGGGGGGGAGFNNDTFNGRAGGSGIVIIRYPSARTVTVGSGLTANTNTSGNNKITTFNEGTGTVSFS